MIQGRQSFILALLLIPLLLAGCKEKVEQDPEDGPQNSLSVIVDGGGKVVSNPAGLDCNGNCRAQFPEGTLVTLTVQSEDDTGFQEWLGACSGTEPTCDVTLNADTAVTARFAPAPEGTQKVTLKWTAPAERTDNTSLPFGEIDGYLIHYGKESGDYTHSITIEDANTSELVLSNLELEGEYHFVVAVLDTDGQEGEASEEVSVQFEQTPGL